MKPATHPKRMSYEKCLKRVGGYSSVVVLPKKWLREKGWTDNQRVTVETKDDHIIIWKGW